MDQKEAKYSWKIGKYWIEFTPRKFFSIKKKNREGNWVVKYIKRCG